MQIYKKLGIGKMKCVRTMGNICKVPDAFFRGLLLVLGIVCRSRKSTVDFFLPHAKWVVQSKFSVSLATQSRRRK